MITATSPMPHWRLRYRLRSAVRRTRVYAHDARWALIGALGFGLLTLWLYAAGGPRVGFAAINGLAPLLPSALWQHLTFLGDGMLLAALALPLSVRYPRVAWAILLGALMIGLCCHIGKSLIPSPRPPGLLEAGTFNVIGPGWRGPSFPSGHTASLFFFAIVVGQILKSTSFRVGLVVAAALLSLTRTIVGVHWPIDLAGGAALGCALGWVAIRVSSLWPLGLKPIGHGVTTAILALTAVLMAAGHDGEYPAVGTFARTIGVLCLLLWALELRAVFVRGRQQIVLRLPAGQPETPALIAAPANTVQTVHVSTARKRRKPERQAQAQAGGGRRKPGKSGRPGKSGKKRNR